LVRTRIYEIIGKFLQCLQKQANRELDAKLFLKMQITLIEGMHDCNLHAQTNAINAAFFLQDPHDKKCQIIACYLKLLRQESLNEVRLLILDRMVINNETFEFFKTSLIYDSDVDVRNRLVTLVLKKIPNKFVDARLRKDMLNCALFRSNRNYSDLAENLIQSWLIGPADDCAENRVMRFIASLDIETAWFTDHDPKNVAYIDEKLLLIMDIVYKSLLDTFELTELISNMNRYVTIDNVLNNFSAAFYFRSLVHFVTKIKFGHLLDDKSLLIDPQVSI
jgi:hypothetical protein